jgi:TonB family protein
MRGVVAQDDERRATMRRCGKGTLALVFLASTVAGAEKQKTTPPMPPDFVIARRTFFDSGPPFDYYELFSVRPTEHGSSVERLFLTPPGIECPPHATLETSTALVQASVPELLGGRNPCSIPEKSLRRELKRCKNCLVFSGAKVTIQVQCGGQTRRIRMDILDSDLFDCAPQTPEHTSWTMAVLGRLDKAGGPGVMEKPMLQIPKEAVPQAAPASATIEALARGEFDALFEPARDTPSILYAESQKEIPQPTVELIAAAPFKPVTHELPKYPPIARMARVQGQVNFRLTVGPAGQAIGVEMLTGAPLFHSATREQVQKWTFGPEVAGQVFEGTIEFRANCSPPAR